MKITFIDANGHITELAGKPGQSLMSLAIAHNIDGIVAECGGACACGTCHCYLGPGVGDTRPAPGPDESAMLEFVMDPQANSRLSCQIILDESCDGLVVHLPATQY